MEHYNLIFVVFYLWRLAITTLDKQSCFFYLSFNDHIGAMHCYSTLFSHHIFFVLWILYISVEKNPLWASLGNRLTEMSKDSGERSVLFHIMSKIKQVEKIFNNFGPIWLYLALEPRYHNYAGLGWSAIGWLGQHRPRGDISCTNGNSGNSRRRKSLNAEVIQRRYGNIWSLFFVRRKTSLRVLRGSLLMPSRGEAGGRAFIDCVGCTPGFRGNRHASPVSISTKSSITP